MKKRLKIISYVFIGIFVCGAVLNMYLKSDIMFNNVENSTRHQESRSSFNSYDIKFAPDQFAIPDSLFYEKTGKWVPACIKEVEVYMPREENEHSSATNIIMKLVYTILIFGSAIMIFYSLSRIMNSVEKSVVFSWKNVRRIRFMSIGFILLFIAEAMNSIYYSYIASSLIKVSDYSIIKGSFNLSFLVISMVTFILAEIFAVGLRLKEEQELTI